MQRDARKVSLPSISAFEVTTLDQQACHRDWLAFREVLAEIIPVEETTWSNLLEKVFSLLEKLMFEELIGMSIYLFDLILSHREEFLPNPADSRDDIEQKQSTANDILDKKFLLIEQCLATDNPTALYFCLEILEMLTDLDIIGERASQILSIARLVDNPCLQSKCYSILLRKQGLGKHLLKEMLATVPAVEKSKLLAPILNVRDCLNWSIIPFTILNCQNKQLSSQLRSQALETLVNLGPAISSEGIIQELVRSYFSQGIEAATVASTLVKGNSQTTKAFITLLKNETLDAKLKAILCMFSREILGATGKLVLEVVVDQSSPSDSWQLNKQAANTEEKHQTQNTSQGTAPRLCLVLGSQLAESLLLRYLQSRSISTQVTFVTEPLNKLELSNLECFKLLSNAAHGQLSSENPGTKYQDDPSSNPLVGKLVSVLATQLSNASALVREAALSSLGYFGESLDFSVVRSSTRPKSSQRNPGLKRTVVKQVEA